MAATIYQGAMAERPDPTPQGTPMSWREKGFVVFYGFFLLEIVVMFVSQLQVGYAKESNVITEWLIDYQGGFVRRGLAGEGLYQIHRWTGASPYYLLVVLCMALYAWLAAYFYRALREHTVSTMLLLPCVFFLGGPIINDFWLRKDVLMLWLFIAVLKLAVRRDQFGLVLVNVLFILGLLIHESIGFFCFPILLLLLVQQERKEGRPGRSAVMAATYKVLPSLATFLLVLYNHGSLGIAEKIWDTWRAVTFPLQDHAAVLPPGSIDGLSWSTWKGLAFTRNTLINFQDGIYAPLAWLVILCSVYFVLTNQPGRGANGSTADVRAIFLLQLAAIMPLFVLGWDYGRWVFTWVASSFAIFLIVPPPTIAEMFPSGLRLASGKFSGFLDQALGATPPLVRLLPFLIGVPGASWTLKGYATTTPVYLSLHLVSTVVQNVLSMGLHKKL